MFAVEVEVLLLSRRERSDVGSGVDWDSHLSQRLYVRNPRHNEKSAALKCNESAIKQVIN